VADCIPGPNLRRLPVGLHVKENRFGWPLRGVIWFYLVIIGSCVVIGLLAGYVQKARSIEKITHRVEAVTFGLE
jgi:hypothetical protein